MSTFNKEDKVGNNLCEFVGPFIGIDNDSYRVIIAKPFQETRSQMICVFVCDEIEIQVVSTQKDITFGVFSFDVPSQMPKDVKIHYFFKEGEKVIENLDGLTQKDLWFYNRSVSQITKTALVSCNNPFSFKMKGISRFNMWEELDKETYREQTELVILAGDQLYNDNLERFLKKKTVDKKAMSASIIRNYLVYFGILPRKKIMARIPSICIWDDHDITDGYGSRPEQFRSFEQNIKWQDFFSVASEAFNKYQAVRNPKNEFRKSFSNYIDIKHTRIYLFDFRTHRNIQLKRLMHPLDLIDFEKSLKTIPDRIKNISLVSPVIVARSTKHFDIATRLLIKSTCFLRDFLVGTVGKVGNFDMTIKKVFHQLVIPDLCDDLDDSLGSSKNNGEFERMIEKLLPSLRNDVTVQILCGDIHIGGESTINISAGDDVFFIPVIVSSPIGYQPMNKFLEKITTSNDVIELVHGKELIITQTNGDYTAKRNFVLLNYSSECLEKQHFFEKEADIKRKNYFINSTSFVKGDQFNSGNVEPPQQQKRKGKFPRSESEL